MDWTKGRFAGTSMPELGHFNRAALRGKGAFWRSATCGSQPDNQIADPGQLPFLSEGRGLTFDPDP